jgi:hypothetical protein
MPNPKLKRTVLYLLISLCALLVPFSAFAAATISITPAGGGVFTLQASGLDAPAGIDITLTFDSSLLSNPRVVQGVLASGAMFAANTGLPGTVHFALLSSRAMGGSGTIATVTFDLAGDSPGAIAVKGSVINLAGTTLPVTFNGWSAPADSLVQTPLVTTPGTSQVTSQVTTPVTTPVTTTGGSVPFMVGGTVTMPSEGPPALERKEVAGEPVPQETLEKALPSPSPPGATAAPETQPAEKKMQGSSPKPLQSVLEKFRLFAGEKTVKSLAALFDRDKDAPFSQIPPICIADGKATVKVIIPHVSGDKAPNFAFDSTRYVSLSQPGDGIWQVEVRPDKGAIKASISMLKDGALQEFPLTVAPKVDADLDKSGKVTEADFLLFLKTRGTESAPRFDLNGDGKRDYLDDYIFTANYLVTTAGKGNK